MRREQDYTDFRMSLRVLGASYEQFVGDEHVGYYWSVLEDEPFDLVESLFEHLTRAEHDAGSKMPSAHQLRKMVVSERSGSQYELPCQQPGCRALIPWPAQGDSESRFYCPRHGPEQSHPASIEERQHILAQLTPEGKAFIRPVLRQLMAAIPISEVEEKAAEAQAVLRRPVAFERTAEGPGVNPGVFLNHPFLSEGLNPDYAERRQMVSAAGWRFEPSQGYWSKGKRKMSDEQVDSFVDTELLSEFLGRR